MSNQSLVNTFVNFPASSFDQFKAEFMPSANNFDYVQHHSFPQFFIDFIVNNEESLSELNNISNTTNKEELASINLQFIQFFMTFGLSYTQNGYLPFETLKSHRKIIEEDLLLSIENESFNNFPNLPNFLENFDVISQCLKSSLKSVIFVFYTNDKIRTIAVGGDNLQKSSIVLIYSKYLARFLNYNSFYYYSKTSIRSTLEPQTPSSNNPLNLFTMYEYTLKNDHWVTQPEAKFFEPILSFLESKNLLSGFNRRADYLSVDFSKLFTQKNSKFVVVGLIGHSQDILSRLKLADSKPYLDRLLSIRHPEILFYYPHNQSRDKHCAYVFLYTPYIGLFKSAYLSPATQAFQDATFDANNRMHSFCSIVTNLQRSLSETGWINSAKAQLTYFNGISILGYDFESDKLDNPYLYGSDKTINVVQTTSESTPKEQVLEFETILHFIQWIEYQSRIFNVQVVLDYFKPRDIRIIAEWTFKQTRPKRDMFHPFTEGEKASCDLSQSLFDMIFDVLKSNQSSTNSEQFSKLKQTITRITAYEDGHIRIKTTLQKAMESKTYKFYRFVESKSRLLIPCYYESIAELHHIHSSYEFINSWALDNGILLALFNSTLEKKILLFSLHFHFKHNTLPTPLFEIRCDDFTKLDKIPEISILHSSYNPKTRTLIFLTVRENKAEMVRLLINDDFQTIGDALTKSIYSLLPIEAASANLKLAGFQINTDGNDAAIMYRANLNIDIDKDIHEKAIYHFIVFFHPFTLKSLYTIKFDVSSYQGIDESNREYQTLKYGTVIPLYYINSTLVLFYLCCAQDSMYSHLVAIISGIKKNKSDNNLYNEEFDFYAHPGVAYSRFLDSINKTVYKSFAAMHIKGIPYIIQRRTTGAIKVCNIFYQANGAQTNIPVIHKFTNPNPKDENISVSSHYGVYNYEAIKAVVVQTHNNYGLNICQQMAMPGPNMLPLQLSLINISTDQFIGDKDKQIDKKAEEKGLVSLVEGLTSTRSIYQIALYEDDELNKQNTLHKSIAPFIMQFFTSCQIVVDECISDPTISSLLNSNFKLVLSDKQISNFKSISHLCYTLRINKFPNFPFLRMTTNCPSFHIAVISENGSSLLSWLTGITFPHLSPSTLAIGSIPIPHLSRSMKCVDDKRMKLRDEAVDGLINVVGSLFTVDEASSCQVIAFICALSSCDKVILDFTSVPNLLRFFDLLFDYFDTVYDLFDFDLFPDNMARICSSDSALDKIKKLPQVAVFCDLGMNSDMTTETLKGDINNLILKRGLDLERSYVVKLVKYVDFIIMSQSKSVIEKAMRLKNMNFADCTKAWRSTNDLMSLLRNMSAIFGQQVDYEANGGFFGFAKESNEFNSKFNLFIPYVKKDEDPKYRNELFSLAMILKKSPEKKNQEAARLLLEKSAELGHPDAIQELNKDKTE